MVKNENFFNVSAEEGLQFIGGADLAILQAGAGRYDESFVKAIIAAVSGVENSLSGNVAFALYIMSYIDIMFGGKSNRIEEVFLEIEEERPYNGMRLLVLCQKNNKILEERDYIRFLCAMDKFSKENIKDICWTYYYIVNHFGSFPHISNDPRKAIDAVDFLN